MIKEIRYICTFQPTYLTCHAVFAHVTNNQLQNTIQNMHIEKPKFKVWFEDKVIIILICDNDFNLSNIPAKIELNHLGKVGYALKYSEQEFISKMADVNIGDYVIASGVISMSRHLKEKVVVQKWGKSFTQGNICPVDSMGNFIPGELQRTLDYLEKNLGINLKTKNADSREFRFEMISWKQLHNGQRYTSKSSSNIVSNKVTLHNAFYFSVNGFISDVAKFKSLEFSSIGKKRSYGMGNIDTDVVNEQEAI